MTDAAISLENVSKRFRFAASRRQSLKERAVRGPSRDGNYFWALKNANFEVPRGATFGLIGPNGSGKSTTLKVVAGIYRPTSGRVTVRGRISALLELGAGFHPELTGRENIALNASILGLTPAQIESASDEIIEFADLGEHIDVPVKVYSSGMYVRLGFAIAVAVRPEILVIDEVIAVGDEQFQRKCFDHLHTLRQSGATVVLVSHSLATIENMCDEAVWIDHGEVRMDGKASEVVKGYIDSVNEVESRVDEEGGLVHVGSGEALIRNVTLRGTHSQTVTAGDGFEAVITFESSCDLEDVIIGLGFRHESGARLAEPNSLDSGLVRLVKGEGEVRFASESLILNPGRYAVTAAIVQTGHFVDLVNEQFDLVVQPSGGNEHGLVRMEGSWEVVQG